MSGADISLPLPNDVDVADMPHIPLYDARLMKSKAWLRAKNWRGGGPGLGFCLINLWSAAFRAIPAGSLEDDEDVLADAANCDIAYWQEIKARALTGWRLIAGRWHHPVVSDIAWDLWQKRLQKRHELAINSCRMATKRALDNGLEPPEPVGRFVDWLADKFPASATYIYARAAQTDARSAEIREQDEPKTPVCGARADDVQRTCSARSLNMSPKVSKGKVISPPVAPPLPPPCEDAPPNGLEGAVLAEITPKHWFAREFTRLETEFGDSMTKLMLAHLQTPEAPGKFRLVQVFKGAWFDPRGPCIVMPTKRRADAAWADHGEWISALWPQLRVRHATVDELRAFKGRSVA